MEDLGRNVEKMEEIDGSAWRYLNPFGFSPGMFVMLMIGKDVGVLMMEGMIHVMAKSFDIKKMPSRTPPIMKGLERLDWKDIIYIGINHFIEIIFAFHLIYLLLTDDQISKSLKPFLEGDVTEMLTTIFVSMIVPFYFMFLCVDFLYYWVHRFMHLPGIYPLCHKHHHKQALPKRGYIDAVNENPLDQVSGLVCVWAAIKILLKVFSLFGVFFDKSELFQVHALGLLVFFTIYTMLGFLSHSEYDVQLGFFGLGYTARAHEMHHRIPNCNFAQNSMIFDKLIGTFKPYKSGQKHT